MTQPALAPDPLLPPVVLAITIVCIAGAGLLANFTVIISLLKYYRNGLSSIIVQLAVADILILVVLSGPELWFFNTRTWNFGKNSCTAFRGLSVFASTASSYLIATIALHTIATVNLEEKASERRNKRNRENEDVEIQSSHHSLVASSDSSTPPRTMNLDYRLIDTAIKVTPPAIFIWVLSASLSIPEFTLATTIDIDEGVTLCTAIDSQHKLNTNSWLTTFNLILPGIIMCIAFILIIFKLNSEKKFLDSQSNRTLNTLKLSLCLITTYLICGVPRSMLVMYRLYSRPFSDNQISSFETEQLNDTISTMSLAFSAAYMLASVLRPVLSMLLMPKIIKVLTFGSKRVSKV